MNLSKGRRWRAAALVLLASVLAVVLIACSSDEAQPLATEPTSQASAQQQDAAADQSQESSASESTSASPQTSTSTEEAESQQADPEQRQESAPAEAAEQEESQQQSAASDQPNETSDADDTDVAQRLEPVLLALQPILGGYQFQQPMELLPLADGSFLIAEQRGYITRFIDDDGEVEQFGVLDLTESTSFGGEQGLLSIALHPEFESDPFLFVYYSPRGTNTSRLSRFRIVQGMSVPATELVIIEIPQPYSNHNGGAIRFGPDGMLYLGIGDGGSANDPQRNGQNRATLLGTIIRIDVNDIDTATPYRVPTDNPFLGIAEVRPEIWAYGMRNPWRMAFDPESGQLWAGDVGQNQVEEIIIVEAGDNHGWNVFEGDACFRGDEACEDLNDAVPPVATYGHDEGCSVTGGVVYRGKALPFMDGVYIFGDYCSGTIWGLWPDDSSETGWTRDVLLEVDEPIASFGVDNDGEVYVLTFNGPILKLVPENQTP